MIFLSFPAAIMQCVKVKLLHAIQSSAFTKKSTSLKEVDLVHKLACFFSPPASIPKKTELNTVGAHSCPSLVSKWVSCNWMCASSHWVYLGLSALDPAAEQDVIGWVNLTREGVFTHSGVRSFVQVGQVF